MRVADLLNRPACRTIGGQLHVGHADAVAVLRGVFAQRRDGTGCPPNLTVIGPTACGKTTLLRGLAGEYDLPLAEVDVTAWPGEADLAGRLVQAADGSRRRAEDRGLVVVEGLDRLAGPAGEARQAELLAFLDSRRPIEFVPDRLVERFDPSRLLFAFVGVFEGMDRVRRQRQPISLRAPVADHPDTLASDLLAYGLRPDLVGRMGLPVTLDALTVPELATLAAEQEQPSLQAIVSPARLVAAPSLWQRVAEQAAALELGARGLPPVLQPLRAALYRDRARLLDGVARVELGDEGLEGRYRVVAGRPELPPLVPDAAAVREEEQARGEAEQFPPSVLPSPPPRVGADAIRRAKLADVEGLLFGCDLVEQFVAQRPSAEPANAAQPAAAPRRVTSITRYLREVMQR